MCVLSLSEADYESVRSHGLGQPEIVELTAMSGLAVYANIIADATGMEADDMFGHNLAIVTQQLSGSRQIVSATYCRLSDNFRGLLTPTRDFCLFGAP
jgi:hypothetical protein